jgi:hypothetical protein
MAVVEPGMRFGYLTAISKVPPRHWLVRCDCGVEKTVQQAQLHGAARPIKSCGCRRIALLRQAQTTHGCSVKDNSLRYKTYIAWQSMLWRCTNKMRRDYKDYGGRGIKVCERWHSFVTFLEDMGLRPAGLTLGRINNDGDYEPGNVRWETLGQQSLNKRSNRFLVFRGQTKTVSEWSQITGIEKSKIRWRLEAGWSTEKALSA